jgi:hypothetical protein
MRVAFPDVAVLVVESVKPAAVMEIVDAVTYPNRRLATL